MAASRMAAPSRAIMGTARRRLSPVSTRTTLGATSPMKGITPAVTTTLPDGLPMWARFLLVSGFAAGGILLFLGVLQRIPLRSALIVPLVGLIIAGVVHAGSGLIAHH